MANKKVVKTDLKACQEYYINGYSHLILQVRQRSVIVYLEYEDKEKSIWKGEFVNSINAQEDYSYNSRIIR